MRDCLLKTPVSAAVAALLFATTSAHSGEPTFMGALSCQSSSCHGGAGSKRNQNLVWTKSDFHSRAYAILATSRSTRIAETLNIKTATESARCTVCHSPFQTLDSGQLAQTARADEGVSCESCHGGAEVWLRSHTRTDYTHRDRVKSGMRELKSSYMRANVCVACHETIDGDILEAGHPQLVFELDSQLVSEPPHWQESDSWSGPRSWLVGQAVALREQSWKRSSGTGSTPRWKALVWILGQVSHSMGRLPKAPSMNGTPVAQDFSLVQHWADDVAHTAENAMWSQPVCLSLLKALAGMEPADAADLQEKISRAQVLVQALDRLTVALKKNDTIISGSDPALKLLFADLHDPHVFDPARFTEHLRSFRKLLTATQPSA